MPKKSRAAKTKLPKDKLLPKLTTYFFRRPKLAFFIWIVLVGFGILSFTTLLRREGFPSVNIPTSIVNGTYFVNDPAKVDNEVAKPISEITLKRSDVKAVTSQSTDNFFSIQIQFKEGTDAKAAAKNLEDQVNSSKRLPASAVAKYFVPYFGATGGDIQQVDEALSFYSKSDQTPLTEVTTKAQEAAKWFQDKNLPLVQSVFIKNPFDTVNDPATGQAVTVQRSFDRYVDAINGKVEFHDSVVIGFAKKTGVDVIKLDNQIKTALADLQKQPQFQGYDAKASASFAPNIKENLNELQTVLLEGLVAILVIGSIVIAIRASIITVIAMVTVILTTIGLMYLVGYSLNVITLFGLILGLSLIVDDTIIMVEAIDAVRAHEKNREKVVKEATRKISRAMVAATLTASLSFAPLIFVSGVLGSFIRAIPITIIASLIISLFVALIFIPFFSRFLLLGKKQMGKEGVKELAAGFEKRLAEFIARPMLWARNSKKRLFTVGIIAIVFGFGFIFAGFGIAKNVVFNIFPPTKDTNGLILSIKFPADKTIAETSDIASKIDQTAADIVGSNFVQSSYYDTGSAQSAMNFIELTSYTKRAVTAPQLVKQLQTKFDQDFKDTKVVVGQNDVGPPNASFVVQIKAEDRAKGFDLAKAVQTFLSSAELKRVSGKTAHLINVTVSSPNEFQRKDDKPIVTVSAGFDGTDTTTLVTLAQDAIKKEFDDNRVKNFGLDASAISFDLGQETENQDSFKALALAFPILLMVIFILLAFQFKSLLQPLLIFSAIPFSIFGVMLGLFLTHNAISFFTMLGFFALIGLSIKNTILLTDFANQARASGLSEIDSAVAALEERFRPLFATSATAVVSLIPLALTSPFWQGLAVVLIFGLLSSTFLVITVFPYYYLGAEYLRLHISRKQFFSWAIITGLITFGASALTKPAVGTLVIPISLIAVIGRKIYMRRMAD